MSITAKYPGKCVKCGEQFEVGVSLINKDDDLSEKHKKPIWVHEQCGDDARKDDKEYSEGYNAKPGEVLDKDPIEEFSDDIPF